MFHIDVKKYVAFSLLFPIFPNGKAWDRAVIRAKNAD